jgi:Protein of unknown function (DUF4238)
VVLQRNRTPVVREWLRSMDEVASSLMAEVSLANSESFHRRARRAEPNMSFEEVEKMRVQLLADFEAGRVRVESTPSREVAAMFAAADQMAEALVMNFTWAILRAPQGKKFVLPDTWGSRSTIRRPATRQAGHAFASSPNSETVMPVDPSFAVALSPGPPVGEDVEVDDPAVEEVNLRAYAWSNAAVYGQSQKVVTDLRHLARRQAQRVGKFKPRPGRIWIAEEEGPRTGEVEFTGYGPQGQTKKRFIVHPGAYDHSEPFRG